MDRDYLIDYRRREIELCQALFSDPSFQQAPREVQLRRLLCEPLSPEYEDYIYCETGGIENTRIYPHDKGLVLNVYPYKRDALFTKHFGDIDEFTGQCIANNRIRPMIQSPLYYEGLHYLRTFFDKVQPVSFFVRGQFAHALFQDDFEPNLQFDPTGASCYKPLADLKSYCDLQHKEWLAASARDRSCWEKSYQRIQYPTAMDESRIVDSLRYRYASVAYYLGQESADQIVSGFSVKDASAILLRFHILFDHVVAHGFGSHFGINLATPEGYDYRNSNNRFVRTFERAILKNRPFPIPKVPDQYYVDLLENEHPLFGIQLGGHSHIDFDEFREIVTLRLERYKKRVLNLRRYSDFTKQTISASCLFAAGASAAIGHPVIGTALVAMGWRGTRGTVPNWLGESLMAAIKRIFTRQTAFLLQNIGSPQLRYSPAGAGIPSHLPVGRISNPVLRERLNVFISYRHESDDHKQQVLDLLLELGEAGLECHSDLLHDKDDPEWTNQWSTWMERSIESADFVLIICSETYASKDQITSNPGEGNASWFELHIIRNLIRQRRSSAGFIPIVLASEDIRYIPAVLGDAHRYDLSKAEEKRRMLGFLVGAQRRKG